MPFAIPERHRRGRCLEAVCLLWPLCPKVFEFLFWKLIFELRTENGETMVADPIVQLTSTIHVAQGTEAKAAHEQYYSQARLHPGMPG